MRITMIRNIWPRLTVIKIIWPRITFGGRLVVKRSLYRTLPNGTLRTIPSGEVRTLPL